MQLADTQLLKIPLAVEESKGLFYVSSPAHEDMFIAVTAREDIRRAVDTCLRNIYGKDGRQVRVYMNCQLGGRELEAVVELI